MMLDIYRRSIIGWEAFLTELVSCRLVSSVACQQRQSVHCGKNDFHPIVQPTPCQLQSLFGVADPFL